MAPRRVALGRMFVVFVVVVVTLLALLSAADMGPMSEEELEEGDQWDRWAAESPVAGVSSQLGAGGRAYHHKVAARSGEMMMMEDAAPAAMRASSPAAMHSAPLSGSLGSDVLKNSVKPVNVAVDSPMLVRRGDMQLETTNDVSQVADQISDITTATNGGYVESRTSWNGSRNRHGSVSGQNVQMRLRVPVDSFFPVIKHIKVLVGDGGVRSSSDTVEDVTEQYIDVAARAASLKATHEQLLALMKKANSVHDVLGVQRELNSVNQQLESQERRMKHLESTSSFSTISINIVQETPPSSTGQRPRWKLFVPLLRVLQRVGRFYWKVIEVLLVTVLGLLPVVCLAWILPLCFPVTFQRGHLSRFCDMVFSMGGSGSGSGSNSGAPPSQRPPRSS
eukprot:CAMPEP_0118962632 /NCGR_PEP_ID=MMETSP1173-20130426/897_1 /TAXON_ID=1034831 /ORGANISM="Rhizochromulina marina cf, Strain CCMP1243" /LENGTH=392 /DNA_ID=CAMNT_0006910917 /DNA_START=82 /DNA_END=1257 /DNA_ORIENTATION=-